MSGVRIMVTGVRVMPTPQQLTAVLSYSPQQAAAAAPAADAGANATEQSSAQSAAAAAYAV